MKAAIFWIEIVCHDCSAIGPCQWFSKRPPIRELIKEAVSRGWRLRTDGQFECQDCTRNALAELESYLDEIYGADKNAKANSIP